MSRTSTLLLSGAGLAVLMLWPSAAMADGKFFPIIGAEAEPTIPFQRALIAYRNGVETMIVESAVQNAGEEVGWVVPLPAEPTEVSACRPNALAATYRLTGPRIESNARNLLWAGSAWFWALLVICFGWAHHHANPNASDGTRIGRIAIVCLGLLVVAFLHMPNLGLSRGQVLSGAEVTLGNRHLAGVYDVQIIAGQDGQPIRAWLTENGFEIPEAAVPVLDDYAKRGWCFAAVRLRADTDETLAPHPLRFVFPTDAAVYPMKLTGVGADEMQLDLYVIGEQTAAAANLKRISCDRYATEDVDYISGYAYALIEQSPVEEGRRFHAESIHMTIGHPDVVKTMWAGCTLTHLRGTLAAADMTEDYTITWSTAEPYRYTVWTAVAAREFGIAVGFFAAGVGVTLITAVWTRSKRPKRKRIVWTCAGSAGLVIACVLLVPMILPSVDTGDTGTGWFAAQRRVGRYWQLLDDGFSGQTEGADFPTIWAAALRDKEGPSRFGNIKFVSGDLPGHYEVEPAPHGWTLTIYDRFATPTRVPIGRDCRPLPRTPVTTQPAKG